MILFTERILFTRIWWGREKNTEIEKETKEKFPVWLPSYPPFYDMDADCFPVSENAENKPDLP